MTGDQARVRSYSPTRYVRASPAVGRPATSLLLCTASPYSTASPRPRIQVDLLVNLTRLDSSLRTADAPLLLLSIALFTRAYDTRLPFVFNLSRHPFRSFLLRPCAFQQQQQFWPRAAARVPLIGSSRGDRSLIQQGNTLGLTNRTRTRGVKHIDGYNPVRAYR